MLSSILSAALIWSLAARALEVTPCGTDTVAFTKDCLTCEPIGYYTYGFLGWKRHDINKACFQRTDYGYRCVYHGTDYDIHNQYFTDRQNVNTKTITVHDPLIGECFYTNEGKLLPKVTVDLDKSIRESWDRCPSSAPRNQKCLDRKLKIEQDEADAKYYNGDKIESDECQKCPKRSESNSVDVSFSESGTMACKYTDDKSGNAFECDYNGTTGKLTGSQNMNDCAGQARPGTFLCLESKRVRDEARRKEEEYKKRVAAESKKALERAKQGGAVGILLTKLYIVGYCAYCEGQLDGKTKFLGLVPCEEKSYKYWECAVRRSWAS